MNDANICELNFQDQYVKELISSNSLEIDGLAS